MSQITLRNGKVVGDYKTPYIVAEVNTSHYGKIETAREMIYEAKNAGCDCVKFQSWSAGSLYSKTHYKRNPFARKIVSRFAFSPEELFSLSEFCKSIGIDFSSTPYSNEEVDFLVDECKAPFVKVSSMEVNNCDFLAYIAKKKVPVIMSTGMAESEEIKNAVDVMRKSGCADLALLHCVSIYPAEVETINLNNMIWLRETFDGCPIGFSDHTMGDAVAIGATALGAAVVEKHITLDASKIGMDNQMAMEPAELKDFVSKCRMVQSALGDYNRSVLPEEYEQRLNMRRSVVSACDIHADDIITRDMLDFKRPGTGYSPNQIDEILGKKARCDIEADLVIEKDYIV